MVLRQVLKYCRLVFSPGRYSANNALDIQSNYFLVAAKGFSMTEPPISKKDFKQFKVAKHFLSFQELSFIFLVTSKYNI